MDVDDEEFEDDLLADAPANLYRDDDKSVGFCVNLRNLDRASLIESCVIEFCGACTLSSEPDWIIGGGEGGGITTSLDGSNVGLRTGFSDRVIALSFFFV